MCFNDFLAKDPDIYIKNLLIHHKWHTSRRNIRVDNLCLLQDDGAFRSEWKMAKVVEVYPDKFGTVRNVQVLVKPNQDGSSKYNPCRGYELKRHVSKLLVLVPAEEQDNVNDDKEVNDAIFDTFSDFLDKLDHLEHIILLSKQHLFSPI